DHPEPWLRLAQDAEAEGLRDEAAAAWEHARRLGKPDAESPLKESPSELLAQELVNKEVDGIRIERLRERGDCQILLDGVRLEDQKACTLRGRTDLPPDDVIDRARREQAASRGSPLEFIPEVISVARVSTTALTVYQALPGRTLTTTAVDPR